MTLSVQVGHVHDESARSGMRPSQHDMLNRILEMSLKELGWDRKLEDFPCESSGGDLSVARVTAVDRGRFLVRGAGGEALAELTGRFLHLTDSSAALPCVGDWVRVIFRDAGSHASIHQVLPRRSVLRRRAAGRDVEFQMIAANIDVAFIVQSCHVDFNLRRLERYLVMVRDGNIEPVLLLTKTDLVTPEKLEQLVGEVRQLVGNAQIVCVSNLTGEGFSEFRKLLEPGLTYCLLGSSGVGKTTLINRLIGHGELETGEVSHTGEGRHTTTRRQLIVLKDGGLVIDMPGMRELGMLGAGEGIKETFSDIGSLAKRCRYPDCRHDNEPGCAVRAAIDRQELSGEHLDSFLKLRRETEFHDMSGMARRKKDRAFGKFVHTYKKQKGGQSPS